ncbi:hypothetical protein BCR34DRAFT_566092 [Clohesyomyces aquaticus]|uniref:Fork-head domain-containing protein n=1 Tax=Clohesyomyces aquaticus TaxID=1231657 RepID=A0A1Y1ZKR2_9PLEO|nr:hypothetical protein BCR34DRAFT_566092 [Clohesyomyces aquaticus]
MSVADNGGSLVSRHASMSLAGRGLPEMRNGQRSISTSFTNALTTSKASNRSKAPRNHALHSAGPVNRLRSSPACLEGAGNGPAKSGQDTPRPGSKRARTPPRITPPPLKRQRLEVGSSVVRKERLSNLLARSSEHIGSKWTEQPTNGTRVHPSHDKDGPAPKPGSTQVNGSNYAPPVAPSVGLFAVPSIIAKSAQRQQHRNSQKYALPSTRTNDNPRPPARDEDARSVSIAIAPSASSTSSAKGDARKCKVCQKGVVHSFNPLFLCPGCLKRHFHEGCRKPALKDSQSRNSWRCFVCIRKARKSLNTSAPTPTDLGRTLPLQSSPPAAPRPSLPPRVVVDKVSSRVPKNGETPDVEKSMQALSVGTPSADSNLTKDVSFVVSKPSTTDGGFHLVGNVPKIGAVGNRRWGVKDDLLDELGDDELDRMILDSALSNASSDTLRRPSEMSTEKERFEIPNTPTQKSSQIPPDSKVPMELQMDGASRSSPADLDDSSQFVTQSQLRMKASQFICCKCQNKRIFTKPGENRAVWQVPFDLSTICSSTNERSQGCKLRRTSLDNDESIQSIPETPESTAVPHADSQEMNVNVQPAPPDPEPSYIPASFPTPFGPGGLLGTASKKIVAKKISVAKVSESTDRIPLEKSPPVNVESTGSPVAQEEPDLFPVAAGNEHVAVNNHAWINEEKDGVNGDQLVTPTAKTLQTREEEGALTSSLATDHSLPDFTPRHFTTSTPVMEATSALDMTPATLSNSLVKDVLANDSGSASRLQKRKFASFSETISEADSASTLNGLSNPDQRRLSTGTGKKPGSYTIREMIGMALLAPWGVALTSKDISTWIAGEFPKRHKEYRDRGEKIWINNTAAVLSSHDDFRKVRTEGGRGSHLWSFQDQPTRKRYEKQFPQYCGKIEHDSLGAHIDMQAPDLTGQSGIVTPAPQQTIQESKNHNPTPSDIGENTQTRPGPKLPKHLTPSREADPRRKRTPFDDLGPHMRLEKDFYKAYPEFIRPSIEHMTRPEINQKIEEIKKRPSRKETFGSVLPFIRNRGRDIHDQLASSRQRAQLANPTPRHRPERNGSKGSRSPEVEKGLRDILDLPENPIPIIYEGHLAFRDGTLINGKLPRARVVYKVGRRML